MAPKKPPKKGEVYVLKRPGILGLTQRWKVTAVSTAMTRVGELCIIRLRSMPSGFVAHYDTDEFHKIFTKEYLDGPQTTFTITSKM